jgi:hypothetical protein
MAEVVYFARDMMFTSKIREVARQLGVSVESVREAGALGAAVAAGARVAIVDLRLPDALAALASVTGLPGSPPVRTIGFIDHERTDVMDAARAAGCQEVLTKGGFAHALPRLLAPPGA